MAASRAAALLSDAQDIIDGGESLTLRSAALAQEAERLFREAGDSDGAAEALYTVVRSRTALGDFEGALKDLVRETESFRSAGDLVGEAFMMLALSELQKERREGKVAAETAARAVSLFKKASNVRREIYALEKVAALHWDMGSNRKALDVANEALRVAKASDDEVLKANAHFLLGRARMVAGFQGALSSAQDALALYKEADSAKGEATALNLVGQVQYKTQHFEEASKSGRQALKAFRRIGASPVDLVSALTTVVYSCLELREADGAMQAVEEELATFKQSNDARGEAGCYPLLFAAHRALNHKNDALEVAQTGINLCRELGHAKGEADLWLGCSELHLTAGMLEAALKESQEALALYQDLGDIVGEASAKAAVSEVYCRRGEVNLAPNRPKALELLGVMADALTVKDSELWKESNERLARLTTSSRIFTQDDERLFFGPIFAKDPAECEAFMEANAPAAGDGEEGGNIARPTFQQHNKQTAYLTGRYGGIHYGPRFRCVDLSVARTSPLVDKYDGDETCALSVLKIQDAATDWERTLEFSPSILDCGLQSGSSLGLTKIREIKKGIKNEKDRVKKEEQDAKKKQTHKEIER